MTKWYLKTIIIIGAILLLIFFIFQNSKIKLFDSAQSMIIFVVQPFQNVTVKIEGFIDGITSGAKYRQEAINLRERLQQMTFDEAQSESIERENEELKKIINFTESDKKPKIIAQIFQSGSIFSNDFLINHGLNDDIKIGDFVTTPNGALVGQVSEVKSNSAKIMIVLDPRFRVIANVQVKDADMLKSMPQGLVEGSHGTALKIKFIPQSEKISIGDVVVSQPLIDRPNIVFPIGTIRRIETTSRDLFQEAVIEPNASFIDFSNVMIY